MRRYPISPYGGTGAPRPRTAPVVVRREQELADLLDAGGRGRKSRGAECPAVSGTSETTHSDSESPATLPPRRVRYPTVTHSSSGGGNDDQRACRQAEQSERMPGGDDCRRRRGFGRRPPPPRARSGRRSSETISTPSLNDGALEPALQDLGGKIGVASLFAETELHREREPRAGILERRRQKIVRVQILRATRRCCVISL